MVRSLPGADQLKVPAYVETIAGGDLIVLERLLGHGLVFAIHVAILFTDEAALGRAVNDLGRRRTLAGVDAGSADVVRLALGLGRVAAQLVVVAAAVLLPAPRARLVPRRTLLAAGLALARAGAGALTGVAHDARHL